MEGIKGRRGNFTEVFGYAFRVTARVPDTYDWHIIRLHTESAILLCASLSLSLSLSLSHRLPTTSSIHPPRAPQPRTTMRFRDLFTSPRPGQRALVCDDDEFSTIMGAIEDEQARVWRLEHPDLPVGGRAYEEAARQAFSIGHPHRTDRRRFDEVYQGHPREVWRMGDSYDGRRIVMPYGLQLYNEAVRNRHLLPGGGSRVGSRQGGGGFGEVDWSRPGSRAPSSRHPSPHDRGSRAGSRAPSRHDGGSRAGSRVPSHHSSHHSGGSRAGSRAPSHHPSHHSSHHSSRAGSRHPSHHSSLAPTIIPSDSASNHGGSRALIPWGGRRAPGRSDRRGGPPPAMLNGGRRNTFRTGTSF